jgi:hypothetical protein
MGASTAERMRVVELLLPVDSAAAFDRREETSGDRDPSEVSEVISLPIGGAGPALRSEAPSTSAVAPSSSVPATSSSEPALHSVPAAVAAVRPAVSPAPSSGRGDPAVARVTPAFAEAFSESIQRWMRQGDSLSERGMRAAEDLSDLDAGLVPALRARALRAARVRRWLSVAAAVVVGLVAALWVTHELSPVAARPGRAAPSSTSGRFAAPPPSLYAPGASLASATAPMAAASGAKSPVASRNHAQPHRRRAANRHHGRR